LLITGEPPKQAEDRKKPNPSACTGLAEHLLPRRHGLIQSFPSCGSTVAVKRARTSPATNTDPNKRSELPGIPFFVKSAGCKHQTVWIQPIYTLSLKTVFTPSTQTASNANTGSASGGSGKPDQKKDAINETVDKKQAKKPEQTTSIETVTLSWEQYRKEPVSKLRSRLTGMTGFSAANAGDVITAWRDVGGLATPDPYSVDENELSGAYKERVIKVANEVTEVSYVDYSTTYYFNSKKPLAGTSQANIKLAADGTMTEGSGQIESKTLQAFLDLVPVKDVLTTVAAAYLPKAPVPPELLALPAGTYQFELTTEVNMIKHTHYSLLKDNNDPQRFRMPPCEPVATDLPNPTDKSPQPYNLLVEKVTGSAEPKGDDSAVKVSGTVKLPKSETK